MRPDQISKPLCSAIALVLLLALLLPLALLAGCGGVQSQKADYLYTQSATGGSIEPGGSAGTYTLTLKGVSPRTVRFTERPERGASTVATLSFIAEWGATFGSDPPNAVLAFTESGAGGLDSAVAEISAPRYEPDSGVLTYQARDLAESKGEKAVDWKGVPLGSLPRQFGAASLFIDSSDVDVSQAGKSFYGLCFGDWVKTQPGYDTPPNSFIDTYLETIAPYASWITTYRVDWPDINYAIKRAHSMGLKVAACAGVTWTAAGPDPSNQPQVKTLVDLVNGGFVDLAIVGNEPEGNRGNPAYPMNRMAADLVAYINTVRQGIAGKVPVGTRLIGQIGADPAFQPIVKACDVVQVNIHPAEYAANGKNITIPQAVARLQNDFAVAQQHLKQWGKPGAELQVGETGWPSSDDPSRPGYVPGLFTVPNAKAFSDGVRTWATSSNVKVFYFEAADEPSKANYNQKNYQANWGVWHWFPNNPAVPFQGQFRKKY